MNIFLWLFEITQKKQEPKGVKNFVVYSCMWSVYFSSNFDEVYFFMFLMKLSSLFPFKDMRGS